MTSEDDYPDAPPRRDPNSPLRFAKYVFAGVMTLVIFMVSYPVQRFLWSWYEEDRAKETALEQAAAGRRANATAVTNADELAAAFRAHHAADAEGGGFLASYRLPGNGETIHFQAAPDDWENPELTPAQRAAFERFVRDYPGLRAALRKHAVDSYTAWRKGAARELEANRTRPFPTHMTPDNFPAVSPDDLERGPTDTTVAISSREKDGLAYVTVSFSTPRTRSAELKATVLGGAIVDEKEMYDFDFEEWNDVWEDALE